MSAGTLSRNVNTTHFVATFQILDYGIYIMLFYAMMIHYMILEICVK